MKIAQVSPRYYPSIGGVESHVQALSERLVKRGFDIDVLATDPTGSLAKQETINGVRVLRFRSWAPGEAYYFSREMRDYLRKNSPIYDLVHAHSYHAMPSLYASQSKAGGRFLFTPHYHGTGHTLFRRLLHVAWRRYAGQIFERSDRVISVSNFERDLVLEDFGLEQGKVVLIPDGLNLLEFEPARKERTARPRGEFRILCVSRLEKYKGIQYLLGSLARLANTFSLEVVGTGPYKRELEREAARLGVSSRVRFLEGLSREELLAGYRDAAVFVLLSKYEAFGIVVAEALASGLPCIVSRTSALTEWIDDETCFGIDYPIDLQRLAELIAQVAASPPVTRVGIMDWDRVADELARLYSASVGPD
jgi:1,2-diacylglycerol 3-alpha-glucosyltransferase